MPGMSNRISGSMLMAVPPAACAIFWANSLACGMNVGIRWPRLTSVFRNGENRDRSQHMSMCPSSACMHSRITDSRAQPKGFMMRNVRMGCRIAETSRFLSHSADPTGARPAPRQNRGPGRHRIGAVGIADGFDVGVLVDVDARTDRYALRQVVGSSGYSHADQRFGVGAHVAANLVAETGKRLRCPSSGRAAPWCRAQRRRRQPRGR